MLGCGILEQRLISAGMLFEYDLPVISLISVFFKKNIEIDFLDFNPFVFRYLTLLIVSWYHQVNLVLVNKLIQ